MLRDLLENSGSQTGARQNGLDGLSGFNTAHPVNIYNSTLGTYCNDFRGGVSVGGTTVGGALTPVGLTTLLEYMPTILGEDGERMGVSATHLMHPPNLKVEAHVLLKSMFFANPVWGGFSQNSGQVGTADNILNRMGVEPFENALLASTKNYYVMDCSKSRLPLTLVEREAPRTVPRVNEDDPIVFDTHKFYWGGWARMSPAWSFPWLILKSGPTANA